MTYLEINDILKQVANKMLFNETTEEGDIILMITESTMAWAVVCKKDDLNDYGKRSVVVKLLSLPPLEMHLSLTDDQLNGEQPFSIDKADTVFIKSVDFETTLDGAIEEIYKQDGLNDRDLSDKIIMSENESIN